MIHKYTALLMIMHHFGTPCYDFDLKRIETLAFKLFWVN